MFIKNIIGAKPLLAMLSAIVLFSCSKEKTPAQPATDACAGKTIVISTSVDNDLACGTGQGHIDITATGSSGFTYKVGTGSYQSNGSFDNLSAGTYTVYAKDAAGCEKSKSVTVGTSGTAGPLFNAVKNLLASRCVSCHNNTVQNGGMNWTVDCNIVQFQNRIKIRAVDEGTMPQGGPQLSTTEKAVITNWINAGGRFTD